MDIARTDVRRKKLIRRALIVLVLAVLIPAATIGLVDPDYLLKLSRAASDLTAW